jgi:membrane protein required for colicin V production
MNWVDGVVLAVLALSAIVALFRGLVQEVLGIGAWVGAAFAALALQPALSPYLLDAVETPWIADAIALAGVFLVVLVVLKIAIAVVARRVQDSALGGTDRALGMVFGLARGAFLVVVAYILGGMVLPPEPERWPDPVRQARSLPLVADGARWLMDKLPPDYRRPLAAPTPPDPGFNDLVRPPPRNRT